MSADARSAAPVVPPMALAVPKVHELDAAGLRAVELDPVVVVVQHTAGAQYAIASRAQAVGRCPSCV